MKVSVLMPTYNHGNSIGRAIESYLRQNCPFETELLIGNDCSPDDTDEVVKKYINSKGNIRYFRANENQGLLKNYQFLIENSSGEYLAILESDDQWLYDDKLKEQVAFLDQNLTHHLSCTAYQHNKKGEVQSVSNQDHLFNRESREVYRYLLLRNVIKSPTVVFRKGAFDKYCDMNAYVEKKYVTFDYPVWCTLANYGHIHYMNKITALYAFEKNSLSNNQSLDKKIEFEKGIEKIRKDLISKFGTGGLALHEIRFREAVVKSRYAIRDKKYLKALLMFLQTYYER